ncbi:copper chaperone PCu(A)C [Pseudoalteromonas xiamenensis]
MFTRLFSLIALGFFTCTSFAHQGHEHEHHTDTVEAISVSHAWVREWLPGTPSTSAYFMVSNQDHHAAKLVKATVEGVGRVEMHEHIHADGMMKMQQVESVEVAPESTLAFQPGGFHLMLFEPAKPIKKGDSLKLTLYFADGDRVFTMADVKSVMEQESSHQHHH